MPQYKDQNKQCQYDSSWQMCFYNVILYLYKANNVIIYNMLSHILKVAGIAAKPT